MVKKIFIRIGLVLLGLLAAFVIAEVAVRIFMPQTTRPIGVSYDPDLGSIHTPSQRGTVRDLRFYTYTYANNSMGFRGPEEYTLEKPGFRVLALGDSFTYGAGVNDDEVFTRRAREYLARATSAPVEVMNAGNSGKGTDYALKFFTARGYRFQPDVTAVFFYWNDYLDNGASEYYAFSPEGELIAKSFENTVYARKQFFRKIPLYPWLARWSHVVNLMKNKLLVPFIKLWKTEELGRLLIGYGGGNPLDPANTVPTEQFVAELARVTREAGSALTFFYIPSREEVAAYREAGRVDEREQFLARFLASSTIPFVSFTPSLASSPEPLDALYRPAEEGGHWTGAAHAIAGDAIGAAIARTYLSGGVR